MPRGSYTSYIYWGHEWEKANITGISYLRCPGCDSAWWVPWCSNFEARMEKWLRSLATAPRWDSVPPHWSVIHCDFKDSATLVHPYFLFVLFDNLIHAGRISNSERLEVDQTDTTFHAGSRFVPIAENIAVENIYVLGQKIEGLRTFEEMLVRGRRLLSPRPPMRDTLAYVMLSSATTGPPKGRWNPCQWFQTLISPSSCYDLAWQHRC